MSDAIINKFAQSSADLWKLKTDAETKGLTVSIFTQDMQDSSDDDKVHQNHLSKKAKRYQTSRCPHLRQKING
jgi:hypothetical protein